MSTTLKFKRFSTANLSTLTGAEGELYVDLDKDVVVVNDGTTAGGFPMQSELVSGTNIKTVNGASILGSGNLDIDSDILSYLTDNSYATQTYVGTQISNLLDGAPEALNTLNELAAALNDDSDFAATVTSQITAAAYTVAKFDSDFGDQTTDVLTEGSTNLYYTSARVDSDITNLVDSDYVALRAPAAGAFSVAANGSYLNWYSSDARVPTGCVNFFIGKNVGNTPSTNNYNFLFGRYVGSNMNGGNNNVVIGGSYTGRCLTSGDYNFFAAGECTGRNTTTGSSNIFLGTQAGCCNTIGNNNVGIGACALSLVQDYNNVAIGFHSIKCITSGRYNVAIGSCTGGSCCGGYNVCHNVSIGHEAGKALSTNAQCNVLIGRRAGGSACNTGCFNVYIGHEAGGRNTTARNNVAIGRYALCAVTTGSVNVALGNCAGRSLTTGQVNAIVGYQAGQCLTTGCCNVLLGRAAGRCITTGHNNIVLGNQHNTSTPGHDSNISNTIILGNPTQTTFKIPGLQTLATDGQVMTYDSATQSLILADAGGGGGAFSTDYAGEGDTDYDFWAAGNVGPGGGGNFFAGRGAGTTAVGATFNAMISSFLGGRDLTTGDYNAVIATGYSGAKITTGNNNFSAGKSAGCGITTGSNNVSIGCGANLCINGGSYNITLGRNANKQAQVSFDNLMVGAYAANGYGISNTTGNTVIGRSAFRNIRCCSNHNIVIGTCALTCTKEPSCKNVILGYKAAFWQGAAISNNVILGTEAACRNKGSSNVVIGNCAGCGASSLSTNFCFSVFIGDKAGKYACGNISNNVAIGPFAGYCVRGSSNIYLGTFAGGGATSGSNNILIGQNAGAGAVPTPLASITTESNRIILGNASHTCAQIQIAWTVVSDCRDKLIHCNLDKGRGFLQNITPIVYSFKDRETGLATEEKVRYGFSAQDVLAAEGDNPVIVSDENPEKLQITSDYIVPVLVNAVKELSAEIETLKAKDADLTSTIEALEARLAALESN